MADCRSLWSTCRQQLCAKVDADTWERYLAGIVPVSLDEDQRVLTLGVLNDFVALWLDSNYKELIGDVLRSAMGQPMRVAFAGGYEAPAADPTLLPAVVRPAAPVTAVLSANRPTSKSRWRLRPDFTFANFVVGDNNRICVAAATAVCAKPGVGYNPFFIYGGSGLGKTHLLQAIANETRRLNPEARIEYLTSEEFVNLYIEAVQNKTLPAFRRHFRSLDLLLIDDVQFFQGKVGTTEEFFHTFNALHNAHRQIVLAADRMPREIGLEDRMITRFDGGLSAEILPPTFETRVAILRKKQEWQSVKLGEDIIFLIASRIQGNLRTLESALTVLTMHVSALGCDMNRDLAERLLRDKFDVEATRTVTVDLIQQRVAERFDLKLADLLGKRRPQAIARARMVAMYLSRELTELSYPAIGEAFNRNHTTIVHAVGAIRDRMAADQDFGATVATLAQQLKG